MMKTMRRDVLKRLVEAGRVVVRESYHFDDMHGESRATGIRKPVGLAPGNPELRRKLPYNGTVYWLRPDEFRSGSGTAYVSGTDPKTGNTLVTLIVHSNSNYDFEILPEPGVSWLPLS